MYALIIKCLFYWPLLGSQGGGWSQSQLHMGEGSVHPSISRQGHTWALWGSVPCSAPRQCSGSAYAVPLDIRTLPVFTVTKIAAPLWKKLNRVAEINDRAEHGTDSYNTYIISLMSNSWYKILDVIFILALVDQEQYSRQNLCTANQPITEQLWSKEGGAILCFCFDSMTRQPRPQRRDHLA